MSSQIDFRTLPANVPVLCIPRVYPNIHEGRIRRIFDDLNLGELERIDIVPKTIVKPGANPLEKGEKFNRVFVHFKRWNNSDNSNIARERLLNGKEIKIVYDEPWFWKISAYREAERKPTSQQHPKNGSEDRRTANTRKPTIAFDSDEDKTSKPQAATHYSSRDDRQRPHRHDDLRERPRKRDDRPMRCDDSHERARTEESFTQKQTMPERKFIEPITPPSSPQNVIKKEDMKNQMLIDYGNIPLPPSRKRIFGINVPKSKPLKIEMEDGELIELTDKNT